MYTFGMSVLTYNKTLLYFIIKNVTTDLCNFVKIYNVLTVCCHTIELLLYSLCAWKFVSINKLEIKIYKYMKYIKLVSLTFIPFVYYPQQSRLYFVLNLCTKELNYMYMQCRFPGYYLGTLDTKNATCTSFLKCFKHWFCFTW